EAVQPLVISSPPCDPCFAGTLDALDRGLAGRRNSAADFVSWATLGLALAAPVRLLAGAERSCVLVVRELRVVLLRARVAVVRRGRVLHDAVRAAPPA